MPDQPASEVDLTFGTADSDRLMATGVGSWPGTDHMASQRAVLDSLGQSSEVLTVPYLVEVPERGPASDMVGRGCATLVDMPAELHSAGWKLASRPGRDQAVARRTLASDLDSFAEAADGYGGPLKVQVVGPWTLCSSVWLPRGERVLSDAGACADVVSSLAEGVHHMVDQVRSRVPESVQLVVQCDEPAWPFVAAGQIPSLSGMSRYRPISRGTLADGFRRIHEAARSAGAAAVWWHSCAMLDSADFDVATDADATLVDVNRLTDDTWEQVVGRLDAGHRIGLGVASQQIQRMPAADVVQRIFERLSRIGMTKEYCDKIVILPSCGLCDVTHAQAVAVSRQVVDIAQRFQARCQEM